MPKPFLHRHPSLESSSSVGDTSVPALRHSLYDAKDEFTERIAPVAMAAIYFGSFTLAPQDAPLSRQALYKLSFLHRHFLQPGGLRITVDRHTAILSGTVTSRSIAMLANILALEIEGIRNVKDETSSPKEDKTGREAVQFLFATDQTLRSGVQVHEHNGLLTLDGEIGSAAQKSWAEQLAEAAGAKVESKIRMGTYTPPPHSPASAPPQLDDESLQALVLFRLRLVRETEHLQLRVKATRGVVTLQGKVRTEALRQRAENIARSTLGLRELRSSLSITA